MRRQWITSSLGVALLLLGDGAMASRPSGKPKTAAVVVSAVDESTGEPVAHVDVRVSRPGRYISESHWEPEWLAETDTAGYVQLTGIPAGEYHLFLCSNDYGRVRLEIQVTAGLVDTVRVGLGYVGPPSDGRRCELRFKVEAPAEWPKLQTGKITIVVTEKETEQPVAFANVVVLKQLWGAMTNEDGMATITLAPGVTRLKVDALGRLSKEEAVRVIAGQTVTLPLQLERDTVQVAKP